jgi:hypothetical protein
MIEMSVDVMKKRDKFEVIVNNVLRPLQQLLSTNAVGEMMSLESGIISELPGILQGPHWIALSHLFEMCVIRPSFGPVIEQMNIVNICSGIFTEVGPNQPYRPFIFISNVLAVNPEPISELIERGFFRSCLDVVIGLEFDTEVRKRIERKSDCVNFSERRENVIRPS